MTGVWAVTRTTFTQCLRSKVGVAAMALLALVLVATPLLVNERSAPLADRIRTFLAYSLGLTTIVICIATILASTAFISGEVQKKQIFILAAKPLARWQYILGRWLGVVLLNVVMLVLAGVGIYAGAQYLRARPQLTAMDRRVVETEIFTARRKIAPDFSAEQGQIDEMVKAHFEKCQKEGTLDEMINSYLPRAGGDVNQAMGMIRQEFDRMARDLRKAIKPGEVREYFFRDVKTAQFLETVDATVQRVDPEKGLMQLSMPKEITARLMEGRPMDIDGAISHITDIDTGRVRVQVASGPFVSKGLSTKQSGDHVSVTIEPFVQMTYKISSSGASGGAVRANWLFVGATQGQGLWDNIVQDDLPNIPVTLSVSARCMDDSGSMVARFFNENAGPQGGASVTIEPGDVSLLYAVGSFEFNFIKALGLLLVIVMFIAALGTMASSFLSFPVAVLMTLVLVIATVMLSFVANAVSFMPMEGISIAMHGVLFVLQLLLPNLLSLVPSTPMVNGEEISFAGEMLRPLLMAIGGTVVILGIACVIFTKRELARVQV